MRRALVVLALIALVLVAAPPARAATHQVRVEDNVFTPELVQIHPDDTVVWSALRPGHTITADDGRFDFHPNRMLDVGEQVSWRFEAEEDVRYYCKIHGGPGGQGMSGIVRVGEPPGRSVPDAPTVVVPDDSPTIRDAAAGARPGTHVLVRPGVYDEEIVASVPGVVIRGLGDTPDDVVVRGGDARDVGVTVAARSVRIVNLTVTGARSAGIAVGPVTGAVLENVRVHDNGLYGIDAQAPAGLTVRSAHITGHGVAGFGVRDCETCGVRIDGSLVERNAAGIVVASANGVVVRATQLRGNAVGIVLRGVTNAQVTGNALTDNDATDVWVAAATAGAEPPTGAGISITGGRGVRVASNTVRGHTYNIAITGPAPSLEHRVVDNIVDDAVHADLAWDGGGYGVCFSRNEGANGGTATSDPPGTAALYGCGMPATAGVPWPIVTANLARHAVDVGFPARAAARSTTAVA